MTFGPVLCCLWTALALRAPAHAPTAPLAAGKPVSLPGTSGRFDFIRFDGAENRLLPGHEGNRTFDVFDLNSNKLLKAVFTGASQDGAADLKRGNYDVSGNDPGRMVIVSSKTLTVTGEVPLPAAADLIAFDPVTGQAHECNDTVAEEWVIDPFAKKIVTTLHFEGRGVEDLTFDSSHKRLLQGVKGSNSIAVTDPTENKALHQYLIDGKEANQ